jgi:hypothetical protein
MTLFNGLVGIVSYLTPPSSLPHLSSERAGLIHEFYDRNAAASVLDLLIFFSCTLPA